ncbi:MAG: O-antigen ligase family protein [Nitrospina sp.]|nr:O-antigen ligase family protein [Nitrospina sp.]
MERVRQIMIGAMAACLALFLVFLFFSISLCQIFGFLGLLLGLALVIMDRRWRAIRFPLGWPVLAFSLLCGIAILLSVDTRASLPFLKRLLEPAVFFWVVNAVPYLMLNPPWKKTSGPTEQNGSLPESACQMGGWLLFFIGAACLGAAGYQLYEAFWLKQVRPFGTLNNPITLGTLFMLVSLALTAFALFAKKNRIWVVIGLVPILAGLVVSQTRSAWVGLVVGLAFLLWKKGWKWLMVLPVALLMLYAALPDDFKARVQTIATASDRAAKERIELWRAGWALMQEHPVKGFGFHTMELVRDQYPQFEHIFVFYRHFHNQYIQFAVDAGIPTLLAWLAIWAVYSHNLRQKLHAWDPGHPAIWLLMTGGSAALAFLVTCVFENQYYDTEFTTLLFTLLAFPYFLRTEKAETSPISGSEPLHTK